MDELLEVITRLIPDVAPRGDGELEGSCPYHTEKGTERKPSFYISRLNGFFFCHSCKEGGSLARLFRFFHMPREEIDERLVDFRSEWERLARIRDLDEQVRDVHLGEHILKESLLGVYEWCPVSLVDAGFDEEILRDYDIGFDNDRDMVIYPIRDLYGNLVGLHGRSVEGRIHKIYKEELRENYPGYSIDKTRHVWNMDRHFRRLVDQPETYIIVEGFKAALKLIQFGYPITFALMGSYLSSIQRKVFQRIQGRAILFLDNDAAGFQGTVQAAKRLSDGGCIVDIVRYPSHPDAKQPDDLTKYEADSAIETCIPYTDWYVQHFDRIQNLEEKRK